MLAPPPPGELAPPPRENPGSATGYGNPKHVTTRKDIRWINAHNASGRSKEGRSRRVPPPAHNLLNFMRFLENCGKIVG